MSAFIAVACGGGGGGSGPPQEAFTVTNGFGAPLLPLRVHAVDASGNPTPQILEIRSLKTLIDNPSSDVNPILPVPAWPTAAQLPSGAPGNHYILIRFGPGFPPDEKSILSPLSPTGLTGALTVVAIDPVSGVQSNVKGRMFVNGRTANNGTIETWVEKGPKVAMGLAPVIAGQVQAGFPGVGSPFTGAQDLVDKRSVVFVADTDGDLATLETFPINRTIRVIVGTGVKSKGGTFWPAESVATCTVGPDTLDPEILVNPGVLTPVIDPPDLSTMVPVDKQVVVSFTESVQPHRVGPIPSNLPPNVTGGIQLAFQQGTANVKVPFTALPASPYDFTKIILTPVYSFPGSYFVNGPTGLPDSNDVIYQVKVDATAPNQIADLVYNDAQHTPQNLNTVPKLTTFTTAPGAGLVNAPVPPEAIYLGFGGPTPGLGVLDLDGFGQGTGTPVQDDPNTPFIDPDTTNFPNNPDITVGAIPPLVIDLSPLAGGSRGPLTLARDSSGQNAVFATPPLLNGVRDMAIGQPLDIVFNNSICQSGTKNICAGDSFHFSNGNNISIAPVPNPPKLAFPPICLAPFIAGIEPVSVNNAATTGYPNSLLKPGNYKGNPQQGIAPTGLFTDSFAVYGPAWPGPSPIPTQLPPACGTYTVRQQIGHFLYVIDPVVRRVVVLNANRMTVITSLVQPDPVDLAMSPDLKTLGVTNFSTSQVQFINTDPLSVDFHKVVDVVNVGQGPSGIAYQPDGEDIFVCNQLSNSVSILEGQTRKIRKTIGNQLQQPFDVALTSRQLGVIGFQAGVYFGYVLNKNGTCALFESGPAGLQGIGFDDIIGLATENFLNSSAILADPANLDSGAWIVHQTAAGLPTASNLVLASSPIGPIPFNNFIIFPSPSFRNREWKVLQTISPTQISGGAPQDIALDETNNVGSLAAGLLQSGTGGASGPLVPHSSKAQIRYINGGPVPVATPKAIFLSNFDVGKIDVIDRSTGIRLIEPVTAPFVQVLCNYWRQ